MEMQRVSDLPPWERCPKCGQPDNCGDCDHTPLNDHELAMMGFIR